MTDVPMTLLITSISIVIYMLQTACKQLGKICKQYVNIRTHYKQWMEKYASKKFRRNSLIIREKRLNFLFIKDIDYSSIAAWAAANMDLF